MYLAVSIEETILRLSKTKKPIKSAHLLGITSHKKGAGNYFVNKLKKEYDIIFGGSSSIEGANMFKKAGFTSVRKIGKVKHQKMWFYSEKFNNKEVDI